MESKYVPEHRRATHKGRNQFRGDELRRRREDQQVEIRKQKKEENLAKRRNLDSLARDWNRTDETSESEDENGVANRRVSLRICVLI
jgi:importin subunit alpha-6/7